TRTGVHRSRSNCVRQVAQPMATSLVRVSTTMIDHVAEAGPITAMAAAPANATTTGRLPCSRPQAPGRKIMGFPPELRGVMKFSITEHRGKALDFTPAVAKPSRGPVMGGLAASIFLRVPDRDRRRRPVDPSLGVIDMGRGGV